MSDAGIPQYARNTDRQGTPIVFIHGIKGSTLVTADGKQRWLGAMSALGLSTPDLQLPLTWKNERQDNDGLQAAKPLTSIPIIPGLFESDVYQPFLQRMAALDRPFYAFVYDWRRDNLESLDAFRACSTAIRQRHGATKLQLIAHSMGGLISFALLNEHPEWFAHALFAGVPFRGGIGFLADMHAGLRTGLNAKITSPAMLFTCPSVYTLFPLGRSDCLSADGKVLPVDFFSAADWVGQRLGIFSLPGSATPERIAFLQAALQRAKKFRHLLIANENANGYPRITVVAGKSIPTLGIAIKAGSRSVRGWDLISAPSEGGDGRVCARNAVPADGVPYSFVETRQEHSAILNDPKIVDLVRDAVATA